MKRPKLFLHIGYPKCGSSYIQNFFYQNRNYFKKNNLLLPKTGGTFSDFDIENHRQFNGHHHLLDLFYKKKNNYIKHLKKELSQNNVQNVLISCETFLKESIEKNLKKTHFINLKKNLEILFSDITIIIVFRNPYEQVENMYKEYCSFSLDFQDQFKTFDEMFKSIYISMLNSQAHIKNWSVVTNQIEVISYSKDSLIKNFLNKIPIKYNLKLLKDVKKIVRKGISPIEAELYKFLKIQNLFNYQKYFNNVKILKKYIKNSNSQNIYTFLSHVQLEMIHSLISDKKSIYYNYSDKKLLKMYQDKIHISNNEFMNYLSLINLETQRFNDQSRLNLVYGLLKEIIFIFYYKSKYLKKLYRSLNSFPMLKLVIKKSFFKINND